MPFDRRVSYRALALLILIALIVFLPVLTFTFVTFDDAAHVYKNPLVQQPNLVSLKRIWSGGFQGLYMPLTYTAWWGLSRSLGVTEFHDSFFYHLLSVATHLVNGFLVWLFMKIWWRERKAAFVAAMCFLLHPLQVEAVAWISGFKDVLCTTFVLLSLVGWLTWMRENKNRFLVLTGLSFLLALLAKPLAVVTPAIWLVLWLSEDHKRFRQLILPGIGFLVALGFAIQAKQLQPDFTLDRVIPWTHRPLIFVDSISFYLSKLLIPIGLTLNYGRTPQFVLSNGNWIFALLAIILLGTLIYRRAGKVVRLLALLWICSLLPTAGLMPFVYQKYSTVADRFHYLAMVWSSAWFAWFLSSHLKTAVVVVFVYSILSISQVQHWRDDVTLIRHMAHVTKETEHFFNLGAMLAERRRYPEAIEAYQTAIKIDEKNANAHNNISTLLLEGGDTAGALKHMRRATELEPDRKTFQSNLKFIEQRHIRP